MSMTATQNANASRTVRELATSIPEATRVFEQMGIDYCCGGLTPLADACAAANIPLERVLSQLEAAQRQRGQSASGEDWNTTSLSRLIEHIVNTHHAYLKQELPRLEKLMAKVVSVHGANHPELTEVEEVLLALSSELGSHLMKEEQILFPYVVGTENGQAPHACFGSVENPIRMMEYEHENAGQALRQLRALTQDYKTPADACISYQTLYAAIQALEADLHQHIHLENNILFPRAMRMG